MGNVATTETDHKVDTAVVLVLAIAEKVTEVDVATTTTTIIISEEEVEEVAEEEIVEILIPTITDRVTSEEEIISEEEVVVVEIEETIATMEETAEMFEMAGMVEMAEMVEIMATMAEGVQDHCRRHVNHICHPII